MNASGPLPDDVRAFLADVSGGKAVAEAEAEAGLWHGSADTDNERYADLALQAARLLEKYGGQA